MNKARRKQIEGIIKRLYDIQEQLSDIASDIDIVREDEECAYEALPEGIQESERGEKIAEAIENIEAAYSEVDLDDTLNDIISYLECAME